MFYCYRTENTIVFVHFLQKLKNTDYFLINRPPIFVLFPTVIQSHFPKKGIGIRNEQYSLLEAAAWKVTVKNTVLQPKAQDILKTLMTLITLQSQQKKDALHCCQQQEDV